jgi:putative addiction module component (TIGR02574 family)
MSPSLPYGLDQLSAPERLALAQDLWDSVAAEEVDRRLAAHRADPQAAVSWNQVEAEALARLRR